MTTDGTIEIELVAELTDAGGAALAVGPDGNISIAASTGSATLWDGEDLAHTVSLSGYHGGPIVFADAGRRARIGRYVVEVGSGDVTSTAVDVDLLTSGLEFAQRAPTRNYIAGTSATNADGTRMAASYLFAPSRGIGDDVKNPGPNGQLVLADPSKGEFITVLTDFADMTEDPALAINDDHIVAVGGSIQVWRTGDGSLVGENTTRARPRFDVRISVDGSQIAVCRADGVIELRPIADVNEGITWTAHPGRCKAVAFHPRKPLLATGGDDMQVKLWSLGDGEPEMVGWFLAESKVNALAFHPFGEHLLVAAQNRVLVTHLV